MSARWLGTTKIKLDTIILPGGFAKRKKEPHVKLLAASIERGGVINLPVVEEKTRALVAGGDRLAALMLLQVRQHEVRLVSGTPAELEEITLEENLRRRRGDDYDAMTKRLVELAEAQHEIAAKTAEIEPTVGRPITPRGEARREIAEKLGKTPNAVRKAEQRAREKEEAAEDEAKPPEVLLAEKPPVTTYGVPLNLKFAQVIVTVQELVDRADGHLRAAQRCLTELRAQGSHGGPIYARTHIEVHRAADVLRRERPDSICPCCKLLQPACWTCTFCGGLGVVNNDKLGACAPELLISMPKAVVLDGKGKFVPYAVEAAKKPVPERKTVDEDEYQF